MYKYYNTKNRPVYKQPVVLLVLEDGVTPIPSAHDVVNRPGILNAQFSRHDPMGTVFVPPVNTIILRTDPFRPVYGCARLRSSTSSPRPATPNTRPPSARFP